MFEKRPSWWNVSKRKETLGLLPRSTWRQKSEGFSIGKSRKLRKKPWEKPSDGISHGLKLLETDGISHGFHLPSKIPFAKIRWFLWFPLGPFNGHFRNRLIGGAIYKAHFLGLNFMGYPHKIWPYMPYMVQYLHFRILKFPLGPWFDPFASIKSRNWRRSPPRNQLGAPLHQSSRVSIGSVENCHWNSEFSHGKKGWWIFPSSFLGTVYQRVHQKFHQNSDLFHQMIHHADFQWNWWDVPTKNGDFPMRISSENHQILEKIHQIPLSPRPARWQTQRPFTPGSTTWFVGIKQL